MKRLGLLIALAAVAAGGLVYTVRHSQSASNTAVAALLPRGTVALVHLPDFNSSRDDWHQTDIYKLYQEPTVRDFLNRPLSKVSQRDATSQTLGDIEKLSPKDAFVAVTSIEDNNPHFVGGFRFRGSEAEADKVISKWRSQVVRDASAHENVDYQQHKIDITGGAPDQIATVYDGQWFFASNDLAELRAVLDRADGREKDRERFLESDENFHAAMAHMPANYALLFYLQPKGISQKLAKLRSAIGAVGGQNDVVDQIRSVCGATRFDSGRMRDVLFVGMTQTQPDRKLSRSSLYLGTADTFLYLATLINPERLGGINQAAWPTGTWLQKVFDAAQRAGVTIDDWKAAFDLELGSLADWPQGSRWPSIIATLRVKDFARASKLVDALTHAIDEDAVWTKTEKNGVAYFSMQTPAVLFAIAPTFALSNHALVVGLDSGSVESAINRSGQTSSGLANSPAYNTAAHAVPAPSGAFVYIDAGMLYSRLDAALRPMLLMSAAFMPAISDYVDVGKLPAPEIVAKHLSPIVSSQRYEGDGYVTESVGPVTLSEAAIGIGLPAILWGENRQH
ncbi:MAG TPA: hypothetical protein VLK27_03175 [Chthoniobacterales bacterium]|nr:hypothetical protein [Chthoniobacterales bacterium]